MKNTLKKVLLICLFVISAVAVVMFAACGDDDKGKDTTVTYTVLVENNEHAPVKGVSVFWGKDGNKYEAVVTGEDGKATMELTPDTYDITLEAASLPDGYSAPESIQQVTKDETFATVTLIKDFRYTVKLVNEDGTPFYHEGVMLAICQLEGSCLTPAPLGTDGVWNMYDVEPGDYKVQIQFPEDIDGTYTFTGSDAGHYYTGEYFSATETEMTIKLTAVSSQVTLNDAGTKAITVQNAAEYATINFRPAKTGVYEICSEGSFDTRVEYCPGVFFLFKNEEDDDSGEGKNFKLGGIEIPEVSNSAQFHIYVKEGATFPATFNIKITRTGDIQESEGAVYAKVTSAQLGDEVYGEGAGVFTEISLSETHEFVKDSHGIYHIGAADGPVLVAKLSGSFRGGGQFSTVRGGGYVVQFVNLNDTAHGWSYIDFWTAYTEKCNSDGVYPVNDEVKLMLERWAAQEIIQYKNTSASLISTLGITEGNEWLVPCGYYAEGTTPPSQNDVAVGEYINENEEILTVNANGTYSISGGMGLVESGTWSKNSENNYTFVCPNYDVTYTVTRDASGKLTFVDNATNEPFYVFEATATDSDAIVGEYTDGFQTLTVNENGTFTIANMMGSTSGAWVKNEDGTYTFNENNPTFGEIPYEVTRDAQGNLTFMDGEELAYEFEVSGGEEP